VQQVGVRDTHAEESLTRHRVARELGRCTCLGGA
jgi:hypothetical protein